MPHPTDPNDAEMRSEPTDLDCSGTDFPVCPYCGEVDADFWTDCREVQYDGDETTHDCPSCGKECDVEIQVSYTCTTRKQEPSK